MPSFFSSKTKQLKSPACPSKSLLQHFNDDFYGSSAAACFSTPSTPKSAASSLILSNHMFDPQQSIYVSFFPFMTERTCDRDHSTDTDSNDSQCDTSSLYETSPAPVASHGHSPGRNANSKPLRPALKKTTSGASTSTRSSTQGRHVSFDFPGRPDDATFTMHSLFGYTYLDHAPISYDIAHPPTSRSILDRRTRAPIAHDTLDEPATNPPRHTQLVLKCHLFPWEVVVRPNDSNSCPSHEKQPYDCECQRAITNLDVLHALHDTLSERVTEDEWVRLGRSKCLQRRISRAYEQRCSARGAGWEDGVRRIDWLEGRTRLVGIEMSGSKDAMSTLGNLVFKSPV
ncbi:hypothetical protein B0H10DRAFT_2219123 [Mycena sp. CBHHK59/15]|nr:hypothetical protein B0H10DRAFT_2219123 [Mycena sp. CBHHK59/15]